MVLEKLGESLRNTLTAITNAVFVDDKLLNELVKEIQKALLQSDVNVKLVLELTTKIKTRFKEEQTPGGLTKKEHLINIVYDELTNFLGTGNSEIKLENKKPNIIMMVGLFGNGKTTTTGKLAKYFKTRGKKVAVMSTDTWRPAAFKQLQQLGKQIEVTVMGNPEAKHPSEIYNQFKDQLNEYDLVIIDTAGRDALNDELVQELNELNQNITPDETLLVMSADMGQTAQTQAETFNKYCKVTGVIITKMEGTAKGGGALSACSITNSTVKFIGVGEKIDDLEAFNPKRFVGKLLGMGDIETLLEKAKLAMSEENAEDMQKKILKGDFNLIDLYEQMKAMSKMGPLAKVMEMIPGFGQMKLPKEAIQVQEGKLKTWKFIIDSCTKGELEEPDEITPQRVDRIAKGSGREVSEIRDLLKQYKQSKKLVKVLKGGNNMDMGKMMKKVQGMGMKFK